jgi:oligosaccharide repeat unit polymerase
VLVCGFAIRRLSLLHPVVLWSGSWAFSTVLYAFRLLPYRNLSWLTAGLICGAVVSFAAGASLSARIRPRRAARDVHTHTQIIELAAWLSAALLVLVFAVFLAGLVSRFGLAHVLQISPKVKLYLSSGEAPLSSTYVEIAIAAATMCALAAASMKDTLRRRRWLATAIASASTVYFSTSRAFIIFLLIAALVAYLSVETRVNRRWLATGAVVAVAIALGLFTGLGAVLGKTYSNSTIAEFDNFFSRHQIARPLALPYQDATASISALDMLTGVSNTWGIAHGCATAPIACGVLRKMGVPALRVPVAGPFTAAPLRWNGYTFLERYLIDFGTGLTLVLVAITGALAAYLWRRAREGSLASTVIYAISVPALMAAYRQNLIEIVFVASIIALSVLVASATVLSTTAAKKATVPTLGRLNALLQRLLAPPPELIAGALRAAGPVAATAGGGPGGSQAMLGGAMRSRPPRRQRARRERRTLQRAERRPSRRFQRRERQRQQPLSRPQREPRQTARPKEQGPLRPPPQKPPRLEPREPPRPPPRPEPREPLRPERRAPIRADQREPPRPPPQTPPRPEPQTPPRPEPREPLRPERRAPIRADQQEPLRPPPQKPQRPEPRQPAHPEVREPLRPKPRQPARAGRRPTMADSPERLDIGGRTPKTKEQSEHYARYLWASRLVRGSVLDVACGTGYGARLLARRANVLGLDRDRGAVEQARTRARGWFSVAEVPPIPIRAHAFDFVVSFETLEHIQDDAEFVREIARVLHPGGKLLLSTPNAGLSDENETPVNPWHVREYTWASLTALLENAGLEVTHRYMQGFPPVLPRGRRLTWRMHAFTWHLSGGVRFALRPLLGDTGVRPFKPRKRPPAYLLVVAKKRR